MLKNLLFGSNSSLKKRFLRDGTNINTDKTIILDENEFIETVFASILKLCCLIIEFSDSFVSASTLFNS